MTDTAQGQLWAGKGRAAMVLSQTGTRAGASAPRWVRDFKRKWQLHLFILLPVIYLLIFAYYPMLGVQIAFKDFQASLGIWRSPWVGMKHFSTFFHSYMFGRVVGNTLKISLYTIITEFPLPILFALALNALRNLRYKKVIQTISYIPHFISTVVLVGLIMQVFSPVHGLYGTLSRLLTGNIYPPDILGNPNAFIHVQVWSGVWQSLGWNSIIYLAALSGIDLQLHEAAQIDGASRLQRMLHIDLPGILPTAAILLIMRAGSIMDVGFEKIFLLQNSMNLTYSEVISTYLYKVGMKAGANNFSYASAIGLFNSVINCVLLVLVNWASGRLSDDNTTLW